MARDDTALVAAALTRRPDAVRALVRELTPVIQIRVARALARSRTGRAQGRSAAQEVEDLTQEVFLSLFDDDARALRSWDPARGAALATFVGVVAEHQVASILRSGRRTPWRDSEEINEASVMERVPGAAGHAPEAHAASREMFTRLLERLRVELSPRGLDLFARLVVDGEAVESICASLEMTPDAVYAWRSRLLKLARNVLTELEGDSMSDPASPDRKKSVRGDER